MLDEENTSNTQNELVETNENRALFPVEILNQIQGYLTDPKDAKNFALTCNFFRAISLINKAPYNQLAKTTEFPLNLRRNTYIRKCIALSDSKITFYYDNNNDITVIDLQEQKEYLLKNHTKPVQDILKISDTLLASSGDKTIRIWDINTFKEIKSFELDAYPSGLTKINNELVAQFPLEKKLQVIDIKNGQTLKRIDLPSSLGVEIRTFLTAENEKLILKYYNTTSTTTNYGMLIRDKNGNYHLETGQGEVCLLPENKLAAIGQGMLRIWDLDSYTLLKTIKDKYTEDFDSAFLCIHLLAKNFIAVMGSIPLKEKIVIWNYQTGDVVNVLHSPNTTTENFTVLENGNIVSIQKNDHDEKFYMKTWQFNKEALVEELVPDDIQQNINCSM